MTPLPPRAKVLRTIAAAEFDLAVVGGGIVGAGVARDAARRGFRTVLIEKDDFGAGTSSRSSRLVHGGVRYLEHGWFHLVFEASRERRRLLDNAPHLVRPLRFTWPVYRQQRLAKWQIGAGLMIYDVLALYRNVAKHKRLSASGVLEREPQLLPADMRGGAMYWDAATDDARLTLMTALDAERAGAILLNHAEVVAATRTGDRIDSLFVRDEPSGMRIQVRARAIVNATGPWTDSLRMMEDPSVAPAVLGTKGVHLLVPRERIGNAGAVTLLHPTDERVMFVLPSGSYAIIGTTDTRTTASPDEVRADTTDVRYLLDAANHYFPSAKLTTSDVVAAWAGIRPLIASASDDGTTSGVSREHEITVGSGGIIAVSGGKLTTYRSMAEEIVDRVAEHLGRDERSDTAHAVLPGGDVDVDQAIVAATDATGDRAIAEHLVRWHGSGWRAIWRLGERTPELRSRIVATSDAIRAELVHAVKHEHARTLADLLMRRTHVAFESRDHGMGVALGVAAWIAPHLGWDEARQAAEMERYSRDVARLFGIDAATLPRRESSRARRSSGGASSQEA